MFTGQNTQQFLLYPLKMDKHNLGKVFGQNWKIKMQYLTLVEVQ